MEGSELTFTYEWRGFRNRLFDFYWGDGGGATTLSLPKIKQKQKQKTTGDRIKKKPHHTVKLASSDV